MAKHVYLSQDSLDASTNYACTIEDNFKDRINEISNLITDMITKNAEPEEMARVIAYSMAVVDAHKQHLDHKQYEEDFNIKQLKEKYQNNEDPMTLKNGVEHPNHYNREGGMECWDEMEMIFGTAKLRDFCLMNVWKYRYRAGTKDDPKKDLEKSDFYFQKFTELKKYCKD